MLQACDPAPSVAGESILQGRASPQFDTHPARHAPCFGARGMKRLLWLALASVAACATSEAPSGLDAHGTGGKGDMGSDTDSAFPQMPNNGGPLLVQPQLVTMTFDDDPDGDTMQAFADWIVTSDWLTTVGGEYGIGPGTNQHIHMSAVNAAVTDTDIRNWLVANIQSGFLPPPGDASAPTLYVWMLGPGARMTDPGGWCTGGYHDEMTIGSQQVAYAVVPTCPHDQVHALTPAQYRQGRASHELIEAFTDPFPESAPGIRFIDSSQLWSSTYGEVGDVCVWNYLPFTAPGGATFYAQRSWSNAAAALGGDPCVPQPAGLTYFNVKAVPSFVFAKPGDSVTFTLQGWTAGGTHGSWWIIQSFSAWHDFAISPVMSAKTIADGGQATVTIPVPATAVTGQHVSITIDSDDSHTNALWPLAIEVQQ
jgi:hypothetical protein